MNAASSGPPPSLWMRLAIKLTGTDWGLLQQCPARDHDAIKAVAELQVSSAIFQAVIFGLAGHVLLAGTTEIHPSIVAEAIGLAVFLMVVDAFAIVRTSWIGEGHEQLRRAGLDLTGGWAARMSSWCMRSIRIAFSIGLSVLTAIAIGACIFRDDIQSHLDQSSIQQNAPVVARATELVDKRIQISTAAVDSQTARVNSAAAQVTKLRQELVDPQASDPQIQALQQEIGRLHEQQAQAAQAVLAEETFAINESAGLRNSPGNSGTPGYGVRYRAAQERLRLAKARADEIEAALKNARAKIESLRAQNSVAAEATQQRAKSQLPEYERALHDAEAKLAQLKSELDRLSGGREEAIRRAAEASPQYVRRDTGFLAQVMALHQIAAEKPWIALIIGLIDVVSFSLELAAVLAKILCFIPTSYAILLVRETHLASLRIADELVTAVNALQHNSQTGVAQANPAAPDAPVASAAEPQANSPAANTVDAAAQPAKRKRGRPRKNPLAVTGANGQAAPTHPPAASATV